MADRFNWAILGTGKIARRFAAALNNLPDQAQLLAVGSRNESTAHAFADTYSIPRRYASYAEVAADSDVDIVYIATPGIFHLRDAMMCLEQGKHVLCEKALTINAREAQTLIALARKKGLFLMEAMWTRFFPIHVSIREMIAEKMIGDVHALSAHFTADIPYDADSRFYDINLGAGVLLDLASYGVSLGSSLFGTPEAVSGLAHFGESGADYACALTLRYSEGQLATIMTSQMSFDEKEAVIIGARGKIVIHAPWYKPTKMTLYREDQPPQPIEIPLNNYNGYEFEALEVMDCISAGRLESGTMPLDESLENMQTLDTFREQWGFKYPFEE